MEDENIVHGTITIQKFDEDGNLIQEEVIKNLITDAGDLYQATRIAAVVNSNRVITLAKRGSISGAYFFLIFSQLIC